MQSFFNKLLNNPYNNLVEKAVNHGKIPIGYTCSYVPDILLNTDKLFPIRMRAPGVPSTELADTYLSNLICSYTRSILEFAMDNRYDFLGGWIFTSGCDHLRRLYDNLNYLIKPGFNYILDLPHKMSDEAVRWYAEEIKLLADSLSTHFDIDIGKESITESILNYNEKVGILNSIGELRKSENPPITGSEFHTILLAALTTPWEMIAEYITGFYEERRGKSNVTEYRARLLLAGGLLDDPGYIKIIESQGGLVIADRFCTGSFPLLKEIPLTEDPFDAIARHYFTKTSCPRMMGEFNNRFDEIIKIVRDNNVDGVVIQTIKFCDTWGVDACQMTESLREAGIPVLRLEREYFLSNEGQLRTRIQAFLESMG